MASSAHVPNQTIIKKNKPSRTDGSKNGFCLEELVPIVAWLYVNVLDCHVVTAMATAAVPVYIVVFVLVVVVAAGS